MQRNMQLEKDQLVVLHTRACYLALVIKIRVFFFLKNSHLLCWRPFSQQQSSKSCLVRLSLIVKLSRFTALDQDHKYVDRVKRFIINYLGRKNGRGLIILTWKVEIKQKRFATKFP